MDSGSRRDEPTGAKTPPEVKVVDRRWWARSDQDASDEAAPSSGKPTYVEELEARLAEKDRVLQGYVEQFKSASAEFEQARVRARREVAREVERGRRSLLVDLLEVVDNLDRAIDAAAGKAPDDPLLAGVRMVRDQFLARLEASGVSEIHTLGEPFDPTLHEAVSVVPSPDAGSHDRVAGVIRRGYRIGDDVLRPAQVAVGKLTSA
jgi:molecular chaperone GrpE